MGLLEDCLAQARAKSGAEGACHGDSDADVSADAEVCVRS